MDRARRRGASPPSRQDNESPRGSRQAPTLSTPSAPAERLSFCPTGVPGRTRCRRSALQGITAHYLAHSTYASCRTDDTCLARRAAGGTGLLHRQLARRAGARVIGTVSHRAEGRPGTERPVPTDAIPLHQPGLRAEILETRLYRRSCRPAGRLRLWLVARPTFLQGSRLPGPRRGMTVLFRPVQHGPVDPYRSTAARISKRFAGYLTRPELASLRDGPGASCSSGPTRCAPLAGG